MKTYFRTQKLYSGNKLYVFCTVPYKNNYRYFKVRIMFGLKLNWCVSIKLTIKDNTDSNDECFWIIFYFMCILWCCSWPGNYKGSSYIQYTPPPSINMFTKARFLRLAFCFLFCNIGIIHNTFHISSQSLEIVMCQMLNVCVFLQLAGWKGPIFSLRLAIIMNESKK